MELLEGSEEGHKNDLRAGTPLQWAKAETVGVVQPGEDTAAGTPSSSLPVPKGGLQENWTGTFYQGHVVIGQGVTALNWKRLDLD